MSPPEFQPVHRQINDMLRRDIIQPPKSLWGAPAILVRREDLHGKPQPPQICGRLSIPWTGLVEAKHLPN